VRGHRAPREDGTLLESGHIAATWDTHPTLESVTFRSSPFGDSKSHLQSGAFRHQTCLEIAPERNQQFACDCDDRNPPDTALEFANAIAELGAQIAVGLMPQPQPRELNHHGASLGIARLADTLITAHRAALKMRRRQTVARRLFAIVKRAVEHFADKRRRKIGPDALDLGQVLVFFALLRSVTVLADAMASRSASIVLIIPMTNSSLPKTSGTANDTAQACHVSGDRLAKAIVLRRDGGYMPDQALITSARWPWRR